MYKKCFWGSKLCGLLPALDPCLSPALLVAAGMGGRQGTGSGLFSKDHSLSLGCLRICQIFNRLLHLQEKSAGVQGSWQACGLFSPPHLSWGMNDAPTPLAEGRVIQPLCPHPFLAQDRMGPGASAHPPAPRTPPQPQLS